MVELLDELQEKRDRYNTEAEKHRNLRDKLNEETRTWLKLRDELNTEVRRLMEQANKHRAERDRLNGEVRAAKQQRDEWNRKANELSKRVSKLKKNYLPRGNIPVGQMKRKLKAMEFQQMTSVLTPDKERELIEAISKYRAEIKERERALEENPEVRKALEEAREAKRKAEEMHNCVEELAQKAQEEHEAMLALYDQSDAVRRDADMAQSDLIRTKMGADTEHRKHIELIRQVHDYDKIIAGLMQKRRVERRGRDDADEKRAAEHIYERLKRGEKLSTEDLMCLQKTGYI